MMTAYGLVDGRLGRIAAPSRASVVWLGLFDPSPQEETAVERLLGLSVPTRADMAKIEESARLYEDGGTLVMTAVVITGIVEGRPNRTPVTFVMSRDHLVSVRYADPLPFRTFEAKCQRRPEHHTTPYEIFLSLLQSIVDRAADVLEQVQADLNTVSMRMFFPAARTSVTVDKPTRCQGKGRSGRRADGAELQATLERLGRKHLVISILRESLLSLSRLVPYLRAETRDWDGHDPSLQLNQIERDVLSLIAYQGQLSSEIVYLHDATLGLINLDQNRVIKVFSIAAVLFLPPTLVGTIYGMNFDAMPELKWSFGYPFALGCMVLSAAIPFVWFRRKRWL